MIDVDVIQTKPINPRGATPGAPVVEEEPQVVIPTPEEIATRARDTFTAMGWNLPENMKPAPIAPAPAPAAAAPAAPAAPVVSNAELISGAAAAAAAKVAELMPRKEPETRQPAPAVPTVDSLDMIPSDREDYEAIMFLERSDRRHAGLGNKFLTYLRDLYSYEEEWLSKNPEKEFNPDDEEHDAWYNDHPAPIDRETIERAKVDRAVEDRYQSRVEPELKAMKADRAWTRASPEIFLMANRQVLAIIKEACPEIAVVLSDSKGEPVLTEANATKADGINPIANDILNRYAARAWPMIVELEKTVLQDVELKLNPNDKVHAAIINMQEAEEQRILADPAERSKDGKRFVTIRDYHRMSEAQQAQCRILTVDDVEALIVKNFAAQAKKDIEYQVNLGKKMFGSTENNNNAPAQNGQETPRRIIPGPQPSGMRVRPPSISSASDVVSTPEPGAQPRKTFGQQAADNYFK